MPITFVGSAAANMHPGRPAGFRVEAIVVHRSGGSRDVIRARFNDPSSSVSAHYLVCRNGDVEQYVQEHDTAFHAGLVASPTWPALRPGVNPNLYTIGVELEGTAGDLPTAQLQAAASLLAAIGQRWGFPADDVHVVPHSAIRESSRCPDKGVSIAGLLAAAKAPAEVLRTPRQTVVRTVSRANLRLGAPSISAPVGRIVPGDSDLRVTGFTDLGEPVQGNAFWYAVDDEGFVWAGATDVPSPAPAGDSDVDGIVSDTTDLMELARRAEPEPRPTADVRIDRTTLVLPAKERMPEVTHKDLIVLHFTAGRTAESAFNTWRRDPARVATAYIVDVDGTIFEVFSPAFWAAHLGLKGTHAHDRRSIGIEIANVGPLQRSTEDPSTLNWWPPKSNGAPEFTTPFCRLDEASRYVAVPYRGKTHFASFPDAQVDAVGALVRTLCDQFSIARTLPGSSRRFEFDPTAFATFRGVCTHANFRRDKWDIGPGFPWDRLEL